MKLLRIILLSCAMAFAYNAGADAQVASKVGKVVKELVKKGSKVGKGTKKTPKTYRAPQYRYVNCFTCHGAGTVTQVDAYGYRHVYKCTKCDGDGKIMVRVR